MPNVLLEITYTDSYALVRWQITWKKNPKEKQM